MPERTSLSSQIKLYKAFWSSLVKKQTNAEPAVKESKYKSYIGDKTSNYLLVSCGTIRTISLGLNFRAWLMNLLARDALTPKGGFSPMIYIAKQLRKRTLEYALVKIFKHLAKSFSHLLQVENHQAILLVWQSSNLSSRNWNHSASKGSIRHPKRRKYENDYGKLMIFQRLQGVIIIMITLLSRSTFQL